MKAADFPLLALSRHRIGLRRCPLLGVEQTPSGRRPMSPNDPLQTFTRLDNLPL
jgi:hypothetical protein